MIDFFDWLDVFLESNINTIGATLALLLMLAVVGAISELES